MNPPRRQTLRRPDRLRKRSDFDRSFREGFRVSTTMLTWAVRPNQGERSRLGLAAGRRLGPAPVRNRAKRQLRELFRRDPELRRLAVDVVLSVRPPAGQPGVGLAEEFRAGRDRVQRRLSRGARG